VRERGGLIAPLEDNTGISPAQVAFDGSPIYGDYAVLSRWWAKRQADPSSRVVLYYNTISLHDGNRVLGVGHPDSSYGARFAMLNSDIERFMDLVRASGRRAVVVFIAEHGAALRGDRRQIQGLREIPTAAITTVPVGIALINADQAPRASQQKFDTPASYPALTELMSRLVANDPFAKAVDDLSSYTDSVPRTDLVAENNGTTVIQAGKHYMMRSPDGTWSSLDGTDSGSR
jgi:cellulose synthase operon protein YhjU